MWTCGSARTTRWAALFWTLWSLPTKDRGRPAKRVAIVNAWEFGRNNKSFGGIIREVLANSTNKYVGFPGKQFCRWNWCVHSQRATCLGRNQGSWMSQRRNWRLGRLKEVQVDAWVLRTWTALFLSCLHLVGVYFQSSSLLCQICSFGERSWCGHNVMDYVICAVSSAKNWCGQDRSGGIGSVKEVFKAQTKLGLASTIVAPYNQAWIAWSLLRLAETNWNLFDRYDLNQLTARPETPKCCLRRLNSMEWSLVSKAADNQGESGWNLGVRWLEVRWFVSCIRTIFSKISDKNGRIETGR